MAYFKCTLQDLLILQGDQLEQAAYIKKQGEIAIIDKHMDCTELFIPQKWFISEQGVF